LQQINYQQFIIMSELGVWKPHPCPPQKGGSQDTTRGFIGYIDLQDYGIGVIREIGLIVVQTFFQILLVCNEE
jgi:hypothetical protein